LQWGLEAIWARIKHLADDLCRQLSTIAGVTVWDAGVERCGIVSFTVDGNNADEIQRWLAKARINVSVSRVSSTRLDMEARGLPNLVRTSVHCYNTAEEIEQFCNVLASR
jgi:cysteine desulfurase/selenocysteine lyase